MLLPTQQSSATATTNLVGSILKDIEKRQAEEAEKAKGTKDDKILKAQVKSDDAQKAANTKINDHFFNQAGNDANSNRMVLIREVGKLFDLKREDFTSDFAFGGEVEKIVKGLEPTMINEIEKKLGLTNLDLSLKDLIEAIKNPDGSQGRKLEAALETKSATGSGQAAGATKAVQRLADAAETKSLDEVQMSYLKDDPTRLADNDAVGEQQKELQALLVKDELDDAKRPLRLQIDEIGLYSLRSQAFAA